MLSGLDTGKTPCLYQIPVYHYGANILGSSLHNLITNKNNKSGVKNKLSTINEISLERKIDL